VKEEKAEYFSPDPKRWQQLAELSDFMYSELLLDILLLLFTLFFLFFSPTK
jgi:hypothetical protein